MYGLVNQAIEDLAHELGGPPLWQRIKADAGVDDAVTYRLVGAASEALGLTPEAVLEAFGRHWILYTGRKGYGPLFDTMGRTLAEFLGTPVRVTQTAGRSDGSGFDEFLVVQEAPVPAAAEGRR